MPPIDFEILKHTALYVILPGACLSGIGALFAATVGRVEPRRSTIATIGLLIAMVVGVRLNRLLPLNEFDTGWRSLFWVFAIASIGDLLISNFSKTFPARTSKREFVAIVVASLLASLLSMPVEFYPSRPWIFGLLVIATVLNWTGLRMAASQSFGMFLPLGLSLFWTGSAVFVMILSHSARFGELAIVLSSALGAVGVVSLISRQGFASIYGGASAMIPGLMLAGALSHSAVPKICYMLVGATPALLGLLQFGWFASWAKKAPVPTLLLALSPSLIAAIVAIVTAPPATESF